jgi:LysM repeat protein
MQCKRCGARLQQGMLICPECGARQGRSPELVRCASCHGRVPVGLTVCPHCGRTVRPASPRWGLWTLLTVALVLVALWGLGRLPVERVRREIIDTRDRLSGLVQVLDLPTSLPPTPTPVRVAAAPRTATPMVFPTIVATQTLTVTLSGMEGADQPVAQAITETLAMTPTSAITPTVSLTLTVSRTPPATQTALTATLTATAASAGSGTPAPAAKGSPTPPTARDSTPIPAVTSTAGVTYVVKAGDTLAGIGAQFGIPWQDIAVANNIGAATGLQIGQRLAIPVAGAPPKPTATPRPKATPTPPAASPTPLSAVSAPVLENPASGSRADGDKTEIELRWQPVPNVPSDAQYQVTVEWIEGGQKNNYVWYTTSTAQRLPTWLWGRADQPTRRYNWFVTVVQVGTDGKGGERVLELSPSSAARWFEWQ